MPTSMKVSNKIEEELDKQRDLLKTPDTFTVDGMCRANGYLIDTTGMSEREINKEKFRRGSIVSREYHKTDEYKALMSNYHKELDRRRLEAREKADKAEVLLIERLDTREDGLSTNEMVAGCIDIIAKELSKRGVSQVEELKTNELINISNHLLGLVKAAAAVRNSCKSMGTAVVAQNVTINNNSSKTGGVIGGLQDVLDADVEEKNDDQ